MFKGHTKIVYGDQRNFLYKNGLYKTICNIIRFRGNQKYRKHVDWDDIQDAISPSTAIFWFISDETIYQNKFWCLILDVDGCFIYLLHELVVYRHFSYFQYGFHNGRQGSRDNFVIIRSNKSFIYKQRSMKVSQWYFKWLWRDSVLNPYTLNIQESLKQTWLALRHWFFEVPGSESVKFCAHLIICWECWT